MNTQKRKKNNKKRRTKTNEMILCKIFEVRNIEKKNIHSLRVKSGGSNVYHKNRDVGAGGQGTVVPPLKRVWV